ncbi:hypothetical protein DIS18_04890 [Algibacter marinivivus]|uniref:Chain length determinant protein n=1 Tax=Algibacter marinivivus TaxID=2100723 RepID=A0A2U2X815_9FLAO|nr:hypothetical protein [Algibacter marinivivus]PWH83893.1 hypothetical protein DIS18_04890 [Algibacter marinivivus]
MSKDSQQSQQSEEVDLGQLFKLIGRMFDNFFKFCGKILYKLFLAFVWCVFFAKTHIITIIVAAIIGFCIGFTKEKLSKPIFKSSIIIKQNYDTGKALNNTIDYYNNLILASDSLALNKKLGIDSKDVNGISGFNMETVLSENQQRKLYYDYIKEVDSVFILETDFETFLENSNNYDFEEQKITILANSNRDFSGVLRRIIKNVESIPYFKLEKQKDSLEIIIRERAVLESLKESDSLRKTYQRVLESKLNQQPLSGSQTSVTIDNTKDNNETKEFELFNSNLVLRKELALIGRQKSDKANIIDIISIEQSEGILDISVSFFGRKTTKKVVYSILFAFLAVAFLSIREFIRFLDKYKNEI